VTLKWTLPKWSCSNILCKYRLLQVTPAITVLIFNPVKVSGIVRLNLKITAVCPCSTFNVIHVIIITTIISLPSINRLTFRMETRVHSVVEDDSMHNAEEVLMRAKMVMAGKIALSAPLKQSIVFIIHKYIHIYSRLCYSYQKDKNG